MNAIESPYGRLFYVVWKLHKDNQIDYEQYAQLKGFISL